MRGERHQDRLSDYERRLLAEIEQSLRAEDPRFCEAFHRPLLRWRAGWLGLVLVAVGGTLTTATFTASVWAASLGLAVMAAGGWIGSSAAGRSARRAGAWWGRRFKRQRPV
jgi:hypothetical protein